MKALKDIKDWKEMINEVVCGDCLEGMKLIPDKAIDLILCDPPYGIDFDYYSRPSSKYPGMKAHNKNYGRQSWNKKKPQKKTFKEMFRVGKNQVVFGGNYFVEHLSSSQCWIVWDKDNGNTDFADCELAWTSFKTAVRKFKFTWNGMLQENMKNKDIRVHPTQKPVELMRWILENYSKEGDLICDPFMGSWTTARACKDLGRDFIGFELSPSYCKIGEKRLQQEILF